MRKWSILIAMALMLSLAGCASSTQTADTAGGVQADVSPTVSDTADKDKTPEPTPELSKEEIEAQAREKKAEELIASMTTEEYSGR